MEAIGEIDLLLTPLLTPLRSAGRSGSLCVEPVTASVEGSAGAADSAVMARGADVSGVSGADGAVSG